MFNDASFSAFRMRQESGEGANDKSNYQPRESVPETIFSDQHPDGAKQQTRPDRIFRHLHPNLRLFPDFCSRCLLDVYG